MTVRDEYLDFCKVLESRGIPTVLDRVVAIRLMMIVAICESVVMFLGIRPPLALRHDATRPAE
jgi:hypothetical protein